ncbi:MAG: phosphatase PAP2 family protein [Bdellovibrionales bacterium]|nr:phosphatase PAP2 family protein [Bdellovibrionales bacterium]
MIQNYVLPLLVVSQAALAADLGEYHHPAPKDPKYLQKAQYEGFKKALVQPPAAGSDAQKKDEAILHDWQKKRTTADCERAKAEVKVSLDSFFGPKSGACLNEVQIAKWAAFFEEIRNDSDYFIQQLKKDFPRKRPFLYVEGIDPCVPKEVTGAYPSGHAAISQVYSRILQKLSRDKKSKACFEKQAKQIAEDRVIVGMHHPTDIQAGRQLGDQLAEAFMASSEFQKKLNAQK